jgi:hypothetical protein
MFFNGQILMIGVHDYLLMFPTKVIQRPTMNHLGHNKSNDVVTIFPYKKLK